MEIKPRERSRCLKREKSLLNISFKYHNAQFYSYTYKHIHIHTHTYVYMYTQRYITLEASLIAWAVKNLSAMQETWVRSLGVEDSL